MKQKAQCSMPELFLDAGHIFVAITWVCSGFNQPVNSAPACQGLVITWSTFDTSAVSGAAALMSDVYEDHKDEDGFLYITYSGENTFGQ